MKYIKLIYQFLFDRWEYELIDHSPYAITYYQNTYKMTNRFTGKVQYIREIK